MKTTHTWLDGMHDHSAMLDSLASQISELGRAFMRTGNENVGGELFEIAQGVRDQSKQVRDLTANKVNGDYREAVQSTANVMKACLAGAEVGKR